MKLAIATVTGAICAILANHRVEAQGLEWGTVKGRITWGGKDLPKQNPIPAVAASQDKAACMKNGHVVLAGKQPIQIECNIHPWMRAWALVFDHPYYAVTDANGAFEFKNAPAGNYRLMVRHGTAGFRGGAKGRNGQRITIKAGTTADLGSLDFPPP